MANRVAAIEKARRRRVAATSIKLANVQSFVNDVSQLIDLTMKQRMRLATAYLQSKVVTNISRPVTRTRGRRTIFDGDVKKRVSFTRITDRSKPGEYPKAETTRLMKDIFTEVKGEKKTVVGYVGTTLDYGLVLELRLRRPFLTRTLYEESDVIKKLLTAEIKGNVQSSI